MGLVVGFYARLPWFGIFGAVFLCQRYSANVLRSRQSRCKPRAPRQGAFGGVCQQAAAAKHINNRPACSIIGDVLLQHGDKVFEEIALLSDKGQGCFVVGFHVCAFEYVSMFMGTQRHSVFNGSLNND